MGSAIRSRWYVSTVLALLFMLGSLVGWAQLDTGSIVGIIRDNTGAVIPGATVKITNANTGQNWTTKTGSAGEYSIPGLPGGFKTGKISNIAVHPEHRVQISPYRSAPLGKPSASPPRLSRSTPPPARAGRPSIPPA